MGGVITDDQPADAAEQLHSSAGDVPAAMVAEWQGPGTAAVPEVLNQAGLIEAMPSSTPIMSAIRTRCVQQARRAIARVRRFRLGIPTSWLQRLRRACLLLSLIAIALLLQLVLGAHDIAPALGAVAAISLVWLGCRWVREYLHPSVSPLWDCLDGVALFLAGTAVVDPYGPAGIVYLSVLYTSLGMRSLSLSGRRVMIGVLVYFNVFVSSTALSAVTGADIRPAAIGFMHLPSLMLVAAGSYVLAVTLTRRDEDAMRREALLAASARLASVSSLDDVAACALDCATVLTSNHDTRWLGMAMEWAGETRLLVRSQDENETAARGIIALDQAPPSLVDSLRSGLVMETDASDIQGLFGDALPAGSNLSASLAPAVVGQSLHGLLVRVGESRLPRPVVHDLERLAGYAGRAIDRLRGDAELREREAAYRSLVEHASDAVTVISDDFRIQFLSPVAARLFRYSPSDLHDSVLTDLAHPGDLANVIVFLEGLYDGRDDLGAIEWRCRCGDGQWLALESTGSNLLDNPQIQGLLLTSRDISDRKALENKLVHQAYHDPLTDLGNRALFQRQLREELRRPLRRSVSHAVMFLDLDRFKIINDSLGHEAGDQLLLTVAERLRNCVRSDDLVARLGGDEFAILLQDIIDEVPAVQVAERILQAMEEPIFLAGHRVFVTASIGIALGSALRDHPKELIRHADVAMYEAKRLGKARYALYDPNLDHGSVERLDLESDLRASVRNRQIEVYYQPLISLESGRIREVEALVRWRHPSRGLLAPREFIGLAEETGLILPIGQHVLRESCRQVAAWQQNGAAEGLRLSVNLSARQFQQPGIVDDIARALDDSRLAPRDLTLEITESVAMVDVDMTIDVLRGLKQLGVQIAIDDFGIGYSALNTLKYFPVDTLKIDRSFVRGLGEDRGDTAIVGAVIACAKALELGVTAEGIETARQVRQLRALDCDQGQGYLISAPIANRDVPNLLARSQGAQPSARPSASARQLTNVVEDDAERDEGVA